MFLLWIKLLVQMKVSFQYNFEVNMNALIIFT